MTYSKDLELLAVFAFAFIAEEFLDGSTGGCSEETINKFKEQVGDLINNFNCDDDNDKIVNALLQSYQNMQEVVASYDDFEYVGTEG